MPATTLPAQPLERPPLSTQLREGTQEAHQSAERGPFVQKFLRGQLERATYVRLLAALHRVYTALEAGLERHREHPVVGPIALPEVYRGPALAADLEHFLGPDWAATAPASPAAARYAERLAALSAGDPALLVAHAYTRYLGDLSGGQILGKRAGKALGLSDAGLEFYAFREIADIPAFKAAYRARLDALPVDERGAAALVAEANHAFAASASLFAELG